MKKLLTSVLDPIIGHWKIPIGHWKFLRDYEWELHLGLFLLYNIVIICTIILWAIFNVLLGIEVTKPLFDILDTWFYSGELMTAPAWRWHLVINFLIAIKCATYNLNNE
jgi:hypothetical protein